MKRLLIVLLALFAVGAGFAQTPETEGKLLNPQKLDGQKWYYSLEEALANPDQVYKLSLEGQKLKTLPAEIGQLKNLQLLNLSNNKLKSLPPELGQLKNLQFISLFKNRLTYLPLEIRELGNIEVLYLGRNRLTEVPVWVGGLGHLRRLDITSNRMTPLEINKIQRMLPKTDITF